MKINYIKKLEKNILLFLFIKNISNISNSFNIINFHWSILFTNLVYLNSKNL